MEKQTMKNLSDAANFIEPEKIPVGIELLTWPFVYAGTTYKEVINDPVKAAEAYLKMFDTIEFDYTWTVGVPIAVQFYEALGVNKFKIAQDGVCIQHVQVDDQYMPVEDYDKLIANPMGYRMNVMMNKLVKAFDNPTEESYQKMKNAAMKLKEFETMNQLIAKGYDEHNVFNLHMPNSVMYISPFLTLFDNLRGIKNSLLDLRRRPEKVVEACDALWAMDFFKSWAASPGFEAAPFNISVFNPECFLSPKWFDRLYVHYLKEGFGDMINKGAKFFIKGEGKFLNLIDQLREFPKGTFIIMLDQDDPFEFYEKFGDWGTLCTGITSDQLKYGTKQTCIDYVKKCVDLMAPGGGFMFMLNKSMMCANDAKIENLEAAYKTINDYGRKSAYSC